MPQWDSHPRCHRRPGKPARNAVWCGLVVVDLVVSCPSSFRFNHQSCHSIGQKLHCTSQVGHFNNAQPSAGLVASASASRVVRFRRRPHQQQPMETSCGKTPRYFSQCGEALLSEAPTSKNASLLSKDTIWKSISLKSPCISASCTKAWDLV